MPKVPKFYHSQWAAQYEITATWVENLAEAKKNWPRLEMQAKSGRRRREVEIGEKGRVLVIIYI